MFAGGRYACAVFGEKVDGQSAHAHAHALLAWESVVSCSEYLSHECVTYNVQAEAGLLRAFKTAKGQVSTADACIYETLATNVANLYQVDNQTDWT